MSDSNPITIVIFGGSGDLARRKLFPALFNLYGKEQLPTPFHIVGAASSPRSDEELRTILCKGVMEAAGQDFDEEQWSAFAQQIVYAQIDLTQPRDFARLKEQLQTLEQGSANRLYHLAVDPEYFMPAVNNLQASGLHQADAGWRRLVIEKPFGHDLASAQELNQCIEAVFPEGEVFRIDHYLGKETAQNILFLRFANLIFEPLWNANYIDNVQISVVENVDVGERARYYDHSGVLRDMFQNHLLQLLSLIAMEPPASFDADAVRDEKVKVLKSILPVAIDETVRGQYHGYRQAQYVAADSQTATYAALKVQIDNWRWQGVPFYLRSGKGLAEKSSEIVIEFKRPPHLMFALPPAQKLTPNILYICIQPDEGIHLQFEAKEPGSLQATATVDLEFHYRTSFKDSVLADAYERLLLDAIHGDATLFTRRDGIEAAWRVIDPILQGWQGEDAPPLASYEPGSWGPATADALLARTGRAWRHGCCEHEA
ncbi:MAG: glucose-6-phosphate dehydrogenase [Caldilineaceae bacterium]